MDFKIKTFKQVLSTMADWVTSNSTKLTNFYVGSVVRTILEAVAVEIESMYFQMYKAFKSAVENSIYNSFGFTKFPATASSGELTFTFKQPLSNAILIPKGYRVSTIPLNNKILYFEVTDDTIAQRGFKTALVPVICTEAGTGGNVPANTIRMPVVRMTEVDTIANDQPFLNGAEEETVEERKKRFTKYINNLSRGTLDAVQYGCLRVSGVAGAYVEEGIGYVQVYCHDANGNLPDELKVQIQNSLLDYRAAGIQVILSPVIKKSIDLNINITLQVGFDPATYESTVKDTITTYLASYPVAKNLIKAELTKTIMSIDENAITNCSIDLAGDVIVSSFELIRPGTINVTAE